MQNLEVVKVDAERNLLADPRFRPGRPGGDVIVRPTVKARALGERSWNCNVNGSAKRRCRSPTRCSARIQREDLVHQVVTAYRNAGRAGTKAQKTRSKSPAATKKFKKQKGGGRATAAIAQPDLRRRWRAFAAKPRSFAQKVNRKMYRGAIASILSELNRQDAQGGRVFELDAPKTRELVAKLKASGSEASADRHRGRSEKLYLSARNLPACRRARCARSGPGQPGRPTTWS
jgi:large subunit ribosomal protein L4